MKKLLQCLWQLPQLILGLILFRMCHFASTKIEEFNNNYVMYVDGFRGGISLGSFIIVDSKAHERVVMHEAGHSKQSLILGPLYLIVIGVPSLIHSIVYNICGRKWNYYSFYTERWADKLSGINRNFN